MLSRVHRRVVSRVAAALVAVALSGVVPVAAEAARPSGAHVCHCPKGAHRCSCPVCGAAEGDHDDDGDPGAIPCRVASACRLPEAPAALDSREPFVIFDSAPSTSVAPIEGTAAIPAAPDDLARPPPVPPPRAATRS